MNLPHSSQIKLLYLRRQSLDPEPRFGEIVLKISKSIVYLWSKSMSVSFVDWAGELGRQISIKKVSRLKLKFWNQTNV
jgi:hypothetical protein